MMSFGWGFGGLAMLAMMSFWVIVVVLAIWLLSRLFPATTSGPNAPTGQGRSTPENAVDIVKQRYARGEISQAEYEDMRRSLQG